MRVCVCLRIVSKYYHSALVRCRFFDTNSISKITSRFSGDINIIDDVSEMLLLLLFVRFHVGLVRRPACISGSVPVPVMDKWLI